MSKPRRARDKNETVRVVLNVSTKFERMLAVVRKTYETSPHQDALCVPYIVMCAAALEAILNNAIVGHASEQCRERQKDYANALLTMSFRSKLDSVAPLLTGFAYSFDKSHWVYQRLSSLISERNNLLHPKPKEHAVEVVRGTHPMYGANFPFLGQDYYDLADDLTLGAGKKYSPQQYHEAIEKFDKWFLKRLPDRVSKIALLVPNAKV